MLSMIKVCGVALIVAAPLVPASAERLFGLTPDNRIVTFDSSTPGTVTSSGAISGIAAGDELVGIDLRPANRRLHSVGTSGNLYVITGNSNGYTATVIGNLTTLATGNSFGIDFNPVPDRLRLISDTNQNLRINPNDAATLLDGAITGPAGPVDIVGAGYTNSRPGATSTTLYAIDAVNDRLLRSTNPNAGTYTDLNLLGVPFGPLGTGISVEGLVGFDISGASGLAFLSSQNRLFGVNLTTGAASSLGTIGSGPLVGLTAGAVPEPATWAMMIGGFGMVGAAMRRSGKPATVTA